MFIVLCRFIGECIEERNDETYDIYGILENKMLIQNKILYLVLKNADCGNSALQSWHGVCSIYGESCMQCVGASRLQLQQCQRQRRAVIYMLHFSNSNFLLQALI